MTWDKIGCLPGTRSLASSEDTKEPSLRGSGEVRQVKDRCLPDRDLGL